MMVYGIFPAGLCLVFLYSGLEKLWYWQPSVEEVPLRIALAETVRRTDHHHQLCGAIFVTLCSLARHGATRWLRDHGDPAPVMDSGAIAKQFRREFMTTLEHLAIVGGFLPLATLESPVGL
jgi:hypothetical protein